MTRALGWLGQDLLHSMLKAMPLLQIVLHTWICVVAIHTIQSQKNHHKVINFLCVLLDLHQQEGTTWCLRLKRAIVGGWVCGCLIPSSPCPADFQKVGHSKMQLAVSKVLMLSRATLMIVQMHKQWSSTCGLTNQAAAAAAPHIRTNTWKKLQPSSFLLQE